MEPENKPNIVVSVDPASPDGDKSVQTTAEVLENGILKILEIKEIPPRPAIPCGRAIGVVESCRTGYLCAHCKYIEHVELVAQQGNDMLGDATEIITTLSEYLGVKEEPHQTHMERLMEAAKHAGGKNPNTLEGYFCAFLDDMNTMAKAFIDDDDHELAIKVMKVRTKGAKILAALNGIGIEGRDFEGAKLRIRP